MKTKAGYVTIIGKPNVGKSTLMNKLIGERLSIISSKPQTTRKRILGILSDEKYQIIFLDTPGILTPNYLLQQKMLDHVLLSVNDADILIYIIDVKNDPTGVDTLENEVVKASFEDKSKKRILLLNKIDLVEPEETRDLALAIKEKLLFEVIFGISALNNFNLEAVRDTIVEYLPEHVKYYPDDQLTNEPERFFVSEIIREKILEKYRDEVPYSVEVIIEEFKKRKTGKDYISASIIVEKPTQKAIIIGNKGAAIKDLGQVSREAIDEFLQRPVFLELFVKVKPNWRSDDNELKKFGYSVQEEE